MERIRDFMDDPFPLNENNPGWGNLNSDEKWEFKDLKAQEK